MGAGSFHECKPNGVTGSIAFKVDTGKACFCRGVTTLNSLVFGDGICAFVTRNPSAKLKLVESDRGRWIAHELYEYFQGVTLDKLKGNETLQARGIEHPVGRHVQNLARDAIP
eukprot:104362-Pelagomonas_calceolata.AAC.20